jgi:hypothetical protein
MAKLGAFSYPDIRFGDAVQIAGRVLNKFKGTVGVKGLAWELSMAQNSGALFAKVAAMRDFGLVDGRGELRVTALAQRILYPVSNEEGQEARAEAFHRVDLFRILHERFEGEVPDDAGLLIALEEITKASRDEIVRRYNLIQKHLADASKVLGRLVDNMSSKNPKRTMKPQNIYDNRGKSLEYSGPASTDKDDGLFVSAGGDSLQAPLTVEFIDTAISFLQAVKLSLMSSSKRAPDTTFNHDPSVLSKKRVRKLSSTELVKK